MLAMSILPGLFRGLYIISTNIEIRNEHIGQRATRAPGKQKPDCVRGDADSCVWLLFLQRDWTWTMEFAADSYKVLWNSINVQTLKTHLPIIYPLLDNNNIA